MGSISLEEFIVDFADGLAAADRRRPIAVNTRSKVQFAPGIGPHSEAQTISLVMAELVRLRPVRYEGAFVTGVPYPSAPQQKCDLCLGTDPQWSWAIEVKMARLLGDNGKANDNMLMHLLSPYPAHRSAVTDCAKLARSALAGRKAILVYGFDHEDWPLDPAIDALEILAAARVRLGPRHVRAFGDLVHAVHSRGRVFAWELLATIESGVGPLS